MLPGLGVATGVPTRAPTNVSFEPGGQRETAAAMVDDMLHFAEVGVSGSIVYLFLDSTERLSLDTGLNSGRRGVDAHVD